MMTTAAPPCQKRKFRSFDHAAMKAARWKKRLGPMHPYYCKECSSWHVGHDAGWWAMDHSR